MLTDGPVPVADVLSSAKDHCADLLILGQEPDGTLYCASTTGDLGRLLLWIETFKHRLLGGVFDGPDDDEGDDYTQN